MFLRIIRSVGGLRETSFRLLHKAIGVAAAFALTHRSTSRDAFGIVTQGYRSCFCICVDASEHFAGRHLDCDASGSGSFWNLTGSIGALYETFFGLSHKAIGVVSGFVLTHRRTSRDVIRIATQACRGGWCSWLGVSKNLSALPLGSHAGNSGLPLHLASEALKSIATLYLGSFGARDV